MVIHHLFVMSNRKYREIRKLGTEEPYCKQEIKDKENKVKWQNTLMMCPFGWNCEVF